MRIVLDTNVLISAVFFGGVPGRILEAWRDGRLQLVLSVDISKSTNGLAKPSPRSTLALISSPSSDF